MFYINSIRDYYKAKARSRYIRKELAKIRTARCRLLEEINGSEEVNGFRLPFMPFECDWPLAYACVRVGNRWRSVKKFMFPDDARKWAAEQKVSGDAWESAGNRSVKFICSNSGRYNDRVLKRLCISVVRVSE